MSDCPKCKKTTMDRKYLLANGDKNPVFVIVRDEPDAICIRDIGHVNHVSVTNRAGEVVQRLYNSGNLNNGKAEGKRLFYFDSMGFLDEILHDGKGNFLNFRPNPGRKAGTIPR